MILNLPEEKLWSCCCFLQFTYQQQLGPLGNCVKYSHQKGFPPVFLEFPYIKYCKDGKLFVDLMLLEFRRGRGVRLADFPAVFS